MTNSDSQPIRRSKSQSNGFRVDSRRNQFSIFQSKVARLAPATARLNIAPVIEPTCIENPGPGYYLAENHKEWSILQERLLFSRA